MPFRLSASPGPWFNRPSGWGLWHENGASGALAGLSGLPRHAVARTYAAIAALVVLVDTFNVFTVLSDSARYGAKLAPWQPVVWEATSGAATLAVCGIAMLACRAAPPATAGWRRAIAVHGAASLIYSALHVGLMAAARAGIYAALGLHYQMTMSQWPYEYRKDLLSYGLIAGIFLFFSRGTDSQSAGPQVSPGTTFDIVDGANLVRVDVADIVAVKAAGNYVEFGLADGRTPLMRGSMRQMEQQLAANGFVRTHRSWLVNRAKVRAMTATGSGDFDVLVDGGLVVPLSRRYPAGMRALRTLRD